MKTGNVLLDGTDSSISAILLEDGFELRQEALVQLGHHIFD